MDQEFLSRIVQSFSVHIIHQRSQTRPHSSLFWKHVNYPWNINVMLSNSKNICTYNKQFRGKDVPTNILSFPVEMDDVIFQAHCLHENHETPAHARFPLGDLILAQEVIAGEIQKFNVPAKEYLAFLIIHGILHLCGYDHDKTHDALLMFQVECKILNDVGFQHPFQ